MTDRQTRIPRDRHPARSARIIATGVSVSSLVSLVTAFNVQALRQNANVANVDSPIEVPPAVALAPLVEAPSSPEPAQPTAAVVSQPSNGGSVAAVAGSVTPVTEPPPVETSAAPSTNRVVLEVPAVAPAPSAVSSGSN